MFRPLLETAPHFFTHMKINTTTIFNTVIAGLILWAILKFATKQTVNQQTGKLTTSFNDELFSGFGF